jgi:orotate phosphoribosyltransferase
MSTPNSAFADFILQNSVIGFFPEPLTLKSGRKSHFYVNWRKPTNDAFLLDRLTDLIVEALAQEAPDCETLYGVPEGASKTAIIAGLKWARRSPAFGLGSHVLAMGRAKPKPHGDPADRFFIGQPKGATSVLEDTITTGLSVFQCLDQLLEAGVKVRGVLCLTDRCERRDDGLLVSEALHQRYGQSMRYLALSRAPDLLKIAVAQQSPPQALVDALAQELGMSLSELLSAKKG